MAAAVLRGSSPELDEEEGGNQAELPEDKPVEEIERGEGAEEAGLQQQHQREIEWRAFLDLPRRQRCRWERRSRSEQQHQQAQAVDAEVILDAEGGDPRDVLAEIAARRMRSRSGPQQQRDGQRERS